MLKTIQIWETKSLMPHLNITVLVEGGIASWDGKDWITQKGDDAGRKIVWPVRWWACLQHFDFVLDANERLIKDHALFHKECQVKCLNT